MGVIHSEQYFQLKTRWGLGNLQTFWPYSRRQHKWVRWRYPNAVSQQEMQRVLHFWVLRKQGELKGRKVIPNRVSWHRLTSSCCQSTIEQEGLGK